MTKFLIFALAAFILYKLFMNDKRNKAKQAQKAEEELAATGQMVKDPICGTFVSKENAIRVREGETMHHFCSYECRNKYLKQIGAHEDKEEESAEK